VSLTRNDRHSESLFDRAHKDPAAGRMPAQDRCRFRGIFSDRARRFARLATQGWENDAGMAPACLVT